MLDRFRQEGCLKARLPRPERGAWTTAVVLNSSGGVAQGDRLTTAITAGPDTRLTVTSQAAERFYRSPGGDPASVRTALTVASGAAMEWLPQEAILFDACALDRRLAIDVAADSWLLAAETIVFGRALMGETVRTAWMRDLIQVRVDGRLVLHDAVRFDGPVQAVLDRPAVAGGGGAITALIHQGPDPHAALERARKALAQYDAGASLIDGLLVARIVAANGTVAREAVGSVLAVLRENRPLPRVWHC